MSKHLTLSLFGLTLPIPRWSIGAFGVLAILGVATVVYRQMFPADLLTLQQANHALSVEIQEYGRHLIDTPTQAFTTEGLVVRVYDDHCLLIQRRTPGAVLTKLVPDLTRGDWSHSPGDHGSVPVAGREQSPINRLMGAPRDESAEPWTLDGSLAVHAAAVSAQPGRCLPQHPGDFATSYGARSGCWVEVWRAWPDGCAHAQHFNTCSGTWDSNPDGSPRVRWVRCVH